MADTKRVPAGRVSVIKTLLAVDGPRLVIRMVFVRILPAKTGLVDAVWPMARFASGLTVVMLVAELLLTIGSNSKAVTLATLTACPLVDAMTEMVTVVAAPFAKGPRSEQNTAPASLVEQSWLGETERNRNPAGNEPVKVTELAGQEPLLVILIV